MDPATRCPTDFKLVLNDSLSDSYERVLGYGSEELRGKTLLHLVWSRRGAAAAVAAILDRLNAHPVDLRLRCRDGRAKCLRLNRLYDKREHLVYIVAEEIAPKLSADVRGDKERRMAVRPD